MLTDRFSDALAFAEQLHRRQTRKGNDIPYVAHLLAVTATVLEWGGDEDTAIAALLHDAVEDQGGDATAQLIRARFGDRVADLVVHCTDSTSADPTQKRPWLERKTAYLERLAHADQPAALITAADKLHNITATIRDVRTHGPETLARFNEPDQVLWYYRAVADGLQPHAASLPMAEFRAAIGELSALVAAGAEVDADAGRQTIIQEAAS
ncbi:MAG TPA: HD domain-containing protein [Phenylobacterium sp.]|nr:HD domain-containing protein [Phenylobacterium sp.]